MFVIDALRLADVANACALWYATPELNISAEFDSPERITAYLVRNPNLSTAARHDGRLIGAVLCGHDGRRGSLYHLTVQPKFRRSGIARRMVDRSLDCLRERDITTAFLFTHEQNRPAQAFWQETGWNYCSWVQYHCREFGDGRNPT